MRWSLNIPTQASLIIQGRKGPFLQGDGCQVVFCFQPHSRADTKSEVPAPLLFIPSLGESTAHSQTTSRFLFKLYFLPLLFHKAILLSQQVPWELPGCWRKMLYYCMSIQAVLLTFCSELPHCKYFTCGGLSVVEAEGSMSDSL